MGACDTREAKGREIFEKGVGSRCVECCSWVKLNKIFECPLFLAI